MFKILSSWWKPKAKPAPEKERVVIRKKIAHKLPIKKKLLKKPVKAQLPPQQVYKAPLPVIKPAPVFQAIKLAPVAPAPKKAESNPDELAQAIVPYIYPYKATSQAAKLLASALNTKRVLEDGHYIPRQNHLVINYGNQRKPNWGNANVKILNHWDAIKASSNKLSALKRFKEAGVQTVQFTSDKKEAIDFVNDGAVIMCRTILNGYGGSGIVVAKTAKEVVDAPLYCVYKKSKAEFRVVVVNGVVVDYMQKKRKLDWEKENGEKVNGMIRNHDNGWIFARDGVVPPKDVLKQAIKAVEAVGLNFAGVDVIFNEHEGKAYVLECNTALGLQPEGTTLKRLTTAFKEICQGKKPTSLV